VLGEVVEGALHRRQAAATRRPQRIRRGNEGRPQQDERDEYREAGAGGPRGDARAAHREGF
jgi:hypothetical protein